MAKAPAIQFYVKDWLSDPELRMASHSTKGIWIDMLCYMWESSERGKICGTLEQIKKLVSATDEDMDLFLSEAKTLQFCDVTICNKNVTVINRRIHQDYKDKQNTRLRVKRFREKQKGNADVTPSSPSPSPSPSPTTKNKDIKRFMIPTVEEITTYCIDRKNTINPQVFIDHYMSNGWMVGKNKMKDWKAAVRTWEGRDNGNNPGRAGEVIAKTGIAKSDGEPYPIDAVY